VAQPDRTVIGEYTAEGACAPIVMIRRGSLKFVHCPVDPDPLYDLAGDPHERVNLAANPAHSARVASFRDEVAQRWDMPQFHAQVLQDQSRRRLVDGALRKGAYTPWDYTPRRDGAGEYMRNHLDLNDVERSARWPRS
jgi:choline-sulfatase